MPTAASHVRTNEKGEIYVMVRSFPTNHMRSDHGEALWCLLIDGQIDDDFAIEGGIVQVWTRPVFTRKVKRGQQVAIGDSDGSTMPAYLRVLDESEQIDIDPIVSTHLEPLVPEAPAPAPAEIGSAPSDNPKEGDKFKTKYGQYFIFAEGSWTPWDGPEDTQETDNPPPLRAVPSVYKQAAGDED
jgi:hypothetical protein